MRYVLPDAFGYLEYQSVFIDFPSGSLSRDQSDASLATADMYNGPEDEPTCMLQSLLCKNEAIIEVRDMLSCTVLLYIVGHSFVSILSPCSGPSAAAAV